MNALAIARERQVPAEADRQQAQDKRRRHAQDDAPFEAKKPVCEDEHRRAQQGRRDIEVLLEQDRGIVAHDIADHPAKARAHRAEQDRGERVRAGTQRDARPQHGEERHARRIGIEQPLQAPALQRAAEERNQQAANEADHDIPGVGHPAYRNLAEQQVADRPAAHAGDDRDEPDADNVHLLAQAEQGAGNGEDRRADAREYDQGRMHGALPALPIVPDTARPGGVIPTR